MPFFEARNQFSLIAIKRLHILLGKTVQHGGGDLGDIAGEEGVIYGCSIFEQVLQFFDPQERQGPDGLPLLMGFNGFTVAA